MRALAFLLLFGLEVLCAQPGSPQRLAFVNRVDGRNHIFFMDLDRSGVGTVGPRLTSDVESEDYPNWSPDGKRLVYQRGLNGAATYVINADGTGQRRLSPTPGLDVTPSWSPDGTKIIYSRLFRAPEPNNPPLTDIRVMNADGSGDHAILAATLFSVEPRWSVRNQIVFMSMLKGDGQLHIFVMNADGTGLQQLTTVGNNGDPAWSPDGSRISFGSDREGNDRVNIFSMNADGTGLTQLTHFVAPFEAGDTSWSSDGTKIAFEFDIGGKKQSDPEAYAQVWTMNADGSNPASTLVRCAGVGGAPRWKPQGDAIPGPPTISLIANAASEVPFVAANTWVEIKGSHLARPGPGRTWRDTDFVLGQMPTQLDGVSVAVNGRAAYVSYVSQTQVNVLTPPDALSGAVQVQVNNNGLVSSIYPIPAQESSPSFFVFNGGPHIAATHADGTPVGPTNLGPGFNRPARPGEVVVLYGNGFGPTTVPVVTGSATQSGILLPTPTVSVGGMSATVEFAGLVGPGLYQINIALPFGLSDGQQPVMALVRGRSTQMGAVIEIRR